jgi:DNA polymerase III delta subunit
MKYYDFVKRSPSLPTLIIIEGTERFFAEAAVSIITDRVIGEADRTLNVDRINATDKNAFSQIEAAAAAFAFLAPARVVLVKNVHELKTDARRAFWKMAQSIRPGNVVIVQDLVATNSKRPEPLSKNADKHTLVIDTTVTSAIRSQFVNETLTRLSIKVGPSVVETLGNSERDLFSIVEDLQKMSLYGRTITVEDILAECLDTTETKVFEFASLLIAGRKSDALLLADELLNDDKGTAIPMLHSLATSYLVAWELCRANGRDISGKLAWQASKIKPYALEIGERRAKIGIERAIKGFEAIVTGKFDDAKTVIALCIEAHPVTH